MSEHTKGVTWYVGKFEDTGCRNQRSIQPTIGVVYGNYETTLANANLIVAASDMLHALEDIVRLNDHVGLTCDNGVHHYGMSEGQGWLSSCMETARAAIAKAKGANP